MHEMVLWLCCLLEREAESIERFPGKETVAAAQQFNYEFRDKVEKARSMYGMYGDWRWGPWIGRVVWNRDEWEKWTPIIKETQKLHAPWNALQSAWAYESPPWRVYYLWQLQELIPPEDYWQGRMPYIVPVWRFEIVK